MDACCTRFQASEEQMYNIHKQQNSQKDTWTRDEEERKKKTRKLRAKINLCAFQQFLSGIYGFPNENTHCFMT